MAEQQSTVEYRDIPGFPGYRVGSDGTVWSCYWNGSRRVLDRSRWKLKAQQVGRKGYFIVTLSRNCRAAAHKVHTIVLTAFVGHRPNGCECRHLDGDQTNNSLSNLKWGTKQENDNDRESHGGFLRGERHPQAKTTDSEVVEIRRRHSAGDSIVKIAKDTHLAKSTIRFIVRRSTWSHVP